MNLNRRLFLFLMKYMPIVFAIGIVVNDVLYNLEIHDYYIINYFCGNSIYTTVMMFISSYVFKYCTWHRVIISYVAALLIISMLNTYNVIDLDRCVEIEIHFILLMITTIVLTYIHFKTVKTKRKTNKQ